MMKIVFHHVNWLITFKMFISSFSQKYENKHLYHVYEESMIRIDGTKQDVPQKHITQRSIGNKYIAIMLSNTLDIYSSYFKNSYK